MGHQPRCAADDSKPPHGSRGKAQLAQQRAERAGDVQRQMLSRNAVEFFAQDVDQRDIGTVYAVLACDLHQPQGPGIGRMIVGVSETGQAPLEFRGIFDSLARPDARLFSRRYAFEQQRTHTCHGADELLSDHHRARGNSDLRLTREGVGDQPRHDRGGRDAVIHEDDHAGIHHRQLAGFDVIAGDDEIERLGEGLLSEHVRQDGASPHHQSGHVGRRAADAGNGRGHGRDPWSDEAEAAIQRRLEFVRRLLISGVETIEHPLEIFRELLDFGRSHVAEPHVVDFGQLLRESVDPLSRRAVQRHGDGSRVAGIESLYDPLRFDEPTHRRRYVFRRHV